MKFDFTLRDGKLFIERDPKAPHGFILPLTENGHAPNAICGSVLSTIIGWLKQEQERRPCQK